MKLIEPGLATLGLVAVAAFTASCATSTEVAEEKAVSDRVCFNTTTVRNFDALTDKYVYVRGRGDEHFLVSTRGWCPELRDAISLAFVDATNRVCSSGFGKIVYRHGLSRGDLESCWIDTIERVNSKDHAKYVVDVRTGRRSEENESSWTELPPKDEKNPDPD